MDYLICMFNLMLQSANTFLYNDYSRNEGSFGRMYSVGGNIIHYYSLLELFRILCKQ